jgi:hypothetical protein
MSSRSRSRCSPALWSIRIPQKRRRDRQRAQPNQVEMLSQREIAQFGVGPIPPVRSHRTPRGY